MKLVFICSPYRGDVDFNVLRARRFCRFAYLCNNLPFAPHLHNTQFLDDLTEAEREEGIKLGLEMLKKSDELWVFGGLITEGMEQEIQFAKKHQISIKYFNDLCEEVDSYE